MKTWLLEYLGFEVENLFIGKEFNGEIYNGYMITNGEKYYIHKGILTFFPRIFYRRYRKIITAYRMIPPNFWAANKSDWLRYLRYFHKGLIWYGLKNIPKRDNISILSIGCGSGWEIWVIINFLSGENIMSKIIGCDIALPPLLKAKGYSRKRRLENVDFVCCVSEALPFGSRKFDLVTAIFGPLDHTLNYPRAFREISRVLRKDGIFVGTTLNRFALDWIIKVIRNPKLFLKTIKYAGKTHARIRIPIQNRYIRIPTHFYNIIEIRKLCMNVRLKILKLLGVFSVLPLDFKKEKFNSLQKVLYKIDKIVQEIPPFSYIGRYIGFVARKY